MKRALIMALSLSVLASSAFAADGYDRTHAATFTEDGYDSTRSATFVEDGYDRTNGHRLS